MPNINHASVFVQVQLSRVWPVSSLPYLRFPHDLLTCRRYHQQPHNYLGTDISSLYFYSLIELNLWIILSSLRLFVSPLKNVFCLSIISNVNYLLFWNNWDNNSLLCVSVLPSTQTQYLFTDFDQKAHKLIMISFQNDLSIEIWHSIKIKRNKNLLTKLEGYYYYFFNDN